MRNRILKPLARQFYSDSFRNSNEAQAAIDKSFLASNMQKVRDYINHGAHEGSIILGASNPILATNPTLLDAAAAALYHDVDIYTNVAERHQQKGNTMRYYSSRSDRAIPVLRNALLQYCASKNFDTENLGFFVTNSILSSIVPAFCNAMLKKDDVILLTNPTYGPFFSTLHRRGMDIRLTNLDAKTNYKITPPILQRMLSESPNAKMFLLINPGNPLGEVYSKEELSALSKIFVEHNKNRTEKLIIFSDEVARNVILSNQEFVSIGSLPGMAEFTYTCWSLSKDVGGPGMGVAVGIGSKELIEKVRVDDAGPPYAIQVGAAQAFALSNQEQIVDHCRKSNEIYQRNIKLVTALFEELNYTINRQFYPSQSQSYSNLIFPTVFPEGGFQMAFHAKGLQGLRFPENYHHHPDPQNRNINNSLDLAWYLRDRAKVEFIPGEGFGFLGDEMILRTTIGKREETLRRAFSQITNSVLELSVDKVRDFQSEEDSRILLPGQNPSQATQKGTLSGSALATKTI